MAVDRSPYQRMSEATLSLDEPQRVLSLFGARDQNVRAIRDRLGVTITHRDGEIHIGGDAEAVAQATRSLWTSGALHGPSPQ